MSTFIRLRRMKIALIGYGKMGKAIEPIALERGHEIVLKAQTSEEVDPQILAEADVAIEFTSPESAKTNILLCFNSNTPVVIGTTGWYENMDEIRAEMDSKNGAMLPATNFSLGVNIFFEINKRLGALMNNQHQYDVMIEETHHIEKLDAPSGTAITIGEDVLSVVDRKKNWINTSSSESEELSIISHREPDVPGTHIVTYESEVDSIILEHVAHSRKGFALGAVIAAEFLAGKTGIYSMKDVLNLN
ncbi:MAG: 4-hydroxy-tetrahydrodipicolinate reductase [Parvicellaceae bacterium]|jgi:4-hydroxy-tetrahydrodipicolinate reductase